MCGAARVVAILAVAFLVLGSWSALETPIDVFPEFVPAQVSIQTEAPGLTPDQVETLITRPIEAAVNGAPALAALRSESIPGLSVVSLDFGADADAQRAHQDVAERLARVAASLPAGSGAPKLSPLTSSTMDVLKIGLVSDRLDRFALRDLADWNLKPLLLARARRRARERVRRRRAADSDRPRRCEARGVRARARRSRRGRACRARAARHRVRRPRGAAGADRLAVARAGRRGARERGPHRAQRRAAHDRRFRERRRSRAALRAGDALVQGRDGVLLTISSQFGANTMDVTRALEGALADIVPQLAADGITVYPALHRPANFIERALGNLRDGLARRPCSCSSCCSRSCATRVPR